jgi:hypothetical protein
MNTAVDQFTYFANRNLSTPNLMSLKGKHFYISFNVVHEKRLGHILNCTFVLKQE